MEWIDCYVRVPNGKHPVLAYSPRDGIHVVWCDGGYGDCSWYPIAGDAMPLGGVTHWAYLPEPPGKQAGTDVSADQKLLAACKRMMSLVQEIDRALGRQPGVIFDAMAAINHAERGK
jgi:hypothetical protein